MTDEIPQARGGRARAAKLSPEERRNIAQKGAEARWSTGAKRGPKPKPPEERVVRKNVSLDENAQKLLGLVQDDLVGRFGFRPTLTQTVLWLINEAKRSGMISGSISLTESPSGVDSNPPEESNR